MRKLLCKSGIGIGLALFSCTALAARELEDTLAMLGKVPVYAFIGFMVVIAASVYFMRLYDKRAAPLSKVYEGGKAIHAVGSDTLITDCVGKMVGEKIGALIVMDGDKLTGIFTERDALDKVLAAGRDPGNTRVSEVMTRNPFCIAPTTTVREAMEMVTKRRIRHLPVVEGGKVLAVVSSGDLTHWLVKDQMGEVQGFVDIPARR